MDRMGSAYFLFFNQHSVAKNSLTVNRNTVETHVTYLQYILYQDNVRVSSPLATIIAALMMCNCAISWLGLVTKRRRISQTKALGRRENGQHRLPDASLYLDVRTI